MDRVMAYMSFIFFQSGMVKSDSEEETAFMALNISIVTRIERDIVEAVRVVRDEGWKMEQSVVAKPGERLEHLWKCDWADG
jgi:hypothetical protein